MGQFYVITRCVKAMRVVVTWLLSGRLRGDIFGVVFNRIRVVIVFSRADWRIIVPCCTRVTLQRRGW